MLHINDEKKAAALVAMLPLLKRFKDHMGGFRNSILARVSSKTFRGFRAACGSNAANPKNIADCEICDIYRLVAKYGRQVTGPCSMRAI